MKNLNEEVIKELKALGIDVYEAKPFARMDSARLGVRVEVQLSDSSVVECPDTFNIEIKNKRGVSTIFSDFKLEERDGNKFFNFIGSIELPKFVADDIGNFDKTLAGTSFIDICWLAGNEEFNKEYLPSATTTVRKEAAVVDIGWTLPSRFIDTFVGSMHILNDVFMSGILEDAMVYVGLSKRKEEPKS